MIPTKLIQEFGLRDKTCISTNSGESTPLNFRVVNPTTHGSIVYTVSDAKCHIKGNGIYNVYTLTTGGNAITGVIESQPKGRYIMTITYHIDNIIRNQSFDFVVT